MNDGIYSCHKTGFGGRCIRDACIDFIPCFKVYNLVSVYPKGIKLNQMTTLNVNFYVVMSAYRWFKFKTCLSSLRNFWMASRGPLSKAKSSGLMEWRDVLCVTSLQRMWFLYCNPLRLHQFRPVSVTSVLCVYVHKGICPGFTSLQRIPQHLPTFIYRKFA